MLYAASGVIFGFVLGYMVASAGGGPAAPAAAPMSPAFSAPAAPQAAAVTPDLDPNELRALESLAKRDPSNTRARIELGNLLMDHEQWDGAIRWYGEALTLEPANADVRVDMGACLVSSGKAAEAIAAFDLALKQQPGHKKALFNKGVALLQAGRPQEAASLWEDLLKRYPDDPQLSGVRDQLRALRAQAPAAKP
jgi:cytochrome c-type biogenesis protein CcmH/NrfG